METLSDVLNMQVQLKETMLTVINNVCRHLLYACISIYTALHDLS